MVTMGIACADHIKPYYCPTLVSHTHLHPPLSADSSIFTEHPNLSYLCICRPVGWSGCIWTFFRCRYGSLLGHRDRAIEVLERRIKRVFRIAGWMGRGDRYQHPERRTWNYSTWHRVGRIGFVSCALRIDVHIPAHHASTCKYS